jgi:hypothetical protein
MKKRLKWIPAFFMVIPFLVILYAWTPLSIDTDPLVRMPGTQPDQVTLENPTRCMNCHADYNHQVEPGFNWKGSMMAHAARDFLFWACLTVAAQDSIWAVGTPNAVDICERCHFPKGWLEGRSDPPNASSMTGADFDGIHCDFCHRMYDPFFETTYTGAREGSDWLDYWDETNNSGTPSQPAADATYGEDAGIAPTIKFFNGGNFFDNNLPPANYTESGSGQYFVSPNAEKRASFADADARHQMLYSRFHKSKYFCSSCHDVSNPVLANLGANPNSPLPTELNSAYSYFHVERTFSEFMLSAYGRQDGAATNPEFQNQGAPDITHAAKCQDCHMRDVVGVGADKNGVPVRPTDSIEHPQSGQPLHDMTGGNAWVSWVLASTVPGSPNYDSFNDQELSQGSSILTLDLTQGEGIDPDALLAGVDRAKQQLLLAASITNLAYNPDIGSLSFRVLNNTGHKLISGFPEGRRMFINIKAYKGGVLEYEVNPYDYDGGSLKGLSYSYQMDPDVPLPHPQALDPEKEAYVDRLVYEMHPESALTGETKSFHFALATGRHKDNRIPPKGFDIGSAADRLSVPTYYVNGTDVGAAYFTNLEYAGGYDDVNMADYDIPFPTDADYIEVNLYYQTTSREYIEFLRDEIKGTGNPTLIGNGAGGDPPYIIQTDPFFAQLKKWGETIWHLWTHNMNIDGAAPFLMAQSIYGASSGCSAPSPDLVSAQSGHTQVTLTWSDEHSADPAVQGYNVYYDQAGKAQLVAEIGLNTTYTDTGLTNGIEYCYKVTSFYDVTCESGFSNIICATPENKGHTEPINWESTKRLTWNSGDSNRPDVTVDTNGNVHSVWEDDNPGNYEIYYRKSTDGGTSWASAVRLSWNSGNSQYPAIATDSSANIHVVWDDDTPGRREVFYRGSPDGGATWSAVKRLTQLAGDSQVPSIAIDSADRVHVVWFDITPGNNEIYFSRSVDGGTTWTNPKRMTWNPSSSRYPSIAAGFGNDIHVVWQDDSPRNEEIYHKRSSDGGSSWLSAKRLTWNSGSSKSPRITADSENNVYVVWSDGTPGNYEIYLKKSTNGGISWPMTKRLTWNSGISGAPAIATDTGGNIFTAWNDSSPGNYEIFFRQSTNGGGSWISERLTWNSGESVVAALATYPSSEIHVVWSDDSPGNYEVYYKKGIQ